MTDETYGMPFDTQKENAKLHTETGLVCWGRIPENFWNEKKTGKSVQRSSSNLALIFIVAKSSKLRGMRKKHANTKLRSENFRRTKDVN
jgi:hypothetical protein